MKHPALITNEALELHGLDAKMDLEALERNKMALLAITSRNKHTKTNWEYLPKNIVFDILEQCTSLDDQKLLTDGHYQNDDHSPYREFLIHNYPQKEDHNLLTDYDTKCTKLAREDLKESLSLKTPFIKKWKINSQVNNLSLSQAKNAILFKKKER